jgi:hypothetical protein
MLGDCDDEHFVKVHASCEAHMVELYKMYNKIVNLHESHMTPEILKDITEETRVTFHQFISAIPVGSLFGISFHLHEVKMQSMNRNHEILTYELI